MCIFKRLSIVASLIVFTSCTGLTTNKPLKDLKDILGIDTENKKEEILIQDEFIQEDIVLTSENVSQYLENVKTRLRNTEKRIETNVSDNYKVLVGEYLAAPLGDGGNRAKITSSPKNTNSRLNVENNNFVFRTIYKGNYGISIYQGNTLLRRVNISALTKYNFTENNIYDIITENLNKKNKTFEDAVSLYKIYYPNGKYIRRVNYWLLEYAYEIENKAILKESVEALKNDLEAFNDEEKGKIIKAANLINKQIFIPTSVYNSSNENLSKEVAGYIKNKATLDKKDVEFLEKVSINESSAEKNLSLEKINNWYSNNGDIKKVKEINNLNTEKQSETLFDTAVKNMKSNPKLAVDNFKKSLANEKNSEKRAETYYNLASSYVNLGNKVEALKYLTLLKQESGASAWAKKAELLLNTLK